MISAIQKIWRNITKIVNAFKQNGSTVKLLRKPERSDVDEAVLNWFNRGRSDKFPVSDHVLMIIFILPKF